MTLRRCGTPPPSPATTSVDDPSERLIEIENISNHTPDKCIFERQQTTIKLCNVSHALKSWTAFQLSLSSTLAAIYNKKEIFRNKREEKNKKYDFTVCGTLLSLGIGN